MLLSFSHQMVRHGPGSGFETGLNRYRDGYRVIPRLELWMNSIKAVTSGT